MEEKEENNYVTKTQILPCVTFKKQTAMKMSWQTSIGKGLVLVFDKNHLEWSLNKV